MITLIIVLLILITLSVILVVFITTFNQFQDYTIRINEAEESIDSTLRMSISIYNEKSDIDALIDGLIKINEMFKKYNKES